MKALDNYSSTELKAIGFDLARQISLSQSKLQEVYVELAKRNELIREVEVTLEKNVPTSDTEVVSDVHDKDP